LQLNWGADLREGRFLLKQEHDKTIPVRTLDRSSISGGLSFADAA
jgi:hypothetical protein